MDEELKQLDLAIAEARRLATSALDALRDPQRMLRDAAAAYIESLASRRVAASRRASFPIIARFSDDELAELRFWTERRIAAAREQVDTEIAECDFWIGEATGLSATDVNVYAAALVPRPKDSKSGIPQSLVFLFDRSLHELVMGLSAVGITLVPDASDRLQEAKLVRAWRIYRERAIECLATWADIEYRYQASTARFQELRWEAAGSVDPATIEARIEAGVETAIDAAMEVSDPAATESSATDDVDPDTRVGPTPDHEALAPVSG